MAGESGLKQNTQRPGNFDEVWELSLISLGINIKERVKQKILIFSNCTKEKILCNIETQSLYS
jgi:hypothetical protein